MGGIWRPEEAIRAACGSGRPSTPLLKACMEQLREVPATVPAADTSWTLFDSWEMRVWNLGHQDREEALELAHEWLALSLEGEPEEPRDVVRLAVSLGLWSYSHYLRGIGQHGDAWRMDAGLGIAHALEMHRAAPFTSSYALLLRWAGPILQGLGCPGQALCFLRGAYHIHQVLAEAAPAGRCLVAIASHHIATGELWAAVDNLRAALRHLPSTDAFCLLTELSLAFCFRSLGQLEEADGCLELVAVDVRFRSPEIQARASWIDGLICLDRGRLKVARALLEKALRLAQENGEDVLVLLVLLDLVRVLYPDHPKVILRWWQTASPLADDLPQATKEAVAACFLPARETARDKRLAPAEHWLRVDSAQTCLYPPIGHLVAVVGSRAVA